MKNIMMLFEDDFEKDGNSQFKPTLYNVKEKFRKQEIYYDIIAYMDKNKLVLIKNRFGSLESRELNSEIIAFLNED